MRIMIKGGVWKNSEDEILKAAVMKYGLNNWSRVASLLLRKSPKQCKARWYCWVDPHVKKTEWTREEEEKLLHLAKLFPCQWNTIAPIVGRTSHQCLEHYEKLLDQAQGNDDKDPEDPRRLRPGEVDPHPETKPARADPVDMDEDEKEMLSEARARLANTRGKKAKRKAREAQLEEARRLATLQKKRELKAAGIAPPRRAWKRKKGVDYANEIPFEQQPPEGFHETGPEEDPKANLGLANINLQSLEGNRRDDEEKRNRKDDERKLKRLKDENLPAYMEMINKMNDPAQLRKKTGLLLPTPAMTDAELDDLVRSGQQMSNLSAEGDEATKVLVPAAATPQVGGATHGLPGSTPLRTPRAQNTVLLEAQDALARNAMQTPLRGEDNADVRMERATGAMPTPKLGGATPSLKEAQTPRTGSGATPASTPARLFPGETPSGKRSNVEKLQQQMAVRSMLEGLPAPENEVEISMPDEPEMPPEEPGLAEDQEEIEARKIKKAMAMRSAAVKQDLPRPLAPKMAQRSSEADSAWEAASELVFAEMQDLVMRDHILYPQKKEKEGKKKILKAPPELESFSQADLKAAAELLQEECKELTPADGAMPTWALELPYLFVPSEKGGDWVLKAEVKPEDQIRALAKEFDSLVKRHDKEKVRIEKVEKKLELMLGGYLNRCGEARGRLGERHQECMSLDADLEAFQRLEELEKAAMRRRVEELEERLKAATEANNDAQKEYRELEETRVKLDKALG